MIELWLFGAFCAGLIVGGISNLGTNAFMETKAHALFDEAEAKLRRAHDLVDEANVKLDRANQRYDEINARTDGGG